MQSFQKLFGAPVLALGFGLLLAASGCTDDGGTDSSTDDETVGEDDTTDTGSGLSHAADIQPIWDDNCVMGCHEPGGSAGSILDLTDGFAAMVNVPSSQAAGKNLVEPGDSTESYVVAKLRGTQVEFGGSGGAMPAGQPMLTDELATVISWIDDGANP